MESKQQFASPEWVKVARAWIQQQCQAADLSGIEMSFCERFTDPPSDLDPARRGVIGWYIRIADGEVEVESGILDDADLLITADYDTVLPLARTVFENNPKGAAEAAKRVQAAAAEGKMSRKGDETKLASVPFFAGMHDVLARRTL